MATRNSSICNSFNSKIIKRGAKRKKGGKKGANLDNFTHLDVTNNIIKKLATMRAYNVYLRV